MVGAVDSVDRVLKDFISEHEKSMGRDQLKEGRKDFLQILLELKEDEDSDLPGLSRDQLKSMLTVSN